MSPPLAPGARITRTGFFQALFAQCDGMIELRAFPSAARCFAVLGDGGRGVAFIADHDAEDVYVGVATRRNASGGSLANCQHLGALFVDVDFKHTPEAEIRGHLAHAMLPPSAIVHSGGGLHCYWFLREPLLLPDEAPRAKALLRRLAAALGGDLAAAEPARILRVPGTWNRKPDYSPARLVQLEQCDVSRRYNAGELDEWLPDEPVGDLRTAPFAMPAQVLDGTRNDMLYRLARSLRAKGLGAQALRAALDAENQDKCSPPLGAAEVAAIAEHALTQPNAPGFETPPIGLAPAPGSAAEVEPIRTAQAPLVVPPLKLEAFYGLAGRVVDCVAPTSEADPAAILLHVLLGAGNLIGRSVYAMVEKTRHSCNEFAVLVGQSAKGRKGQAWSTPRALFEQVNPEWMAARVRTGLSSGEGLIYHVRDAREEPQPVKDHGRVVEYQTVMVDPGEVDKRLLIFEPELASVLRRMNGETSSLSAVMRQAWESGDLSTLTRRDALRATGAHVSVIAHVTREELIANLTETERANGFANRFLFCLVTRSKVLPEGGGVPDIVLAPLVEDLHAIAARATGEPRELRRTPAAREMWEAIYGALSEGDPGLLGAILARAEAHVLRLSLLYAALDSAAAVDTPHLEAALALWDYADASARAIFGGRSGMVEQDTLVSALRARGPLSQTEISGLFHRNKTAQQLEALLALAEEGGRIRKGAPAPSERGGRPVRLWEAIS